MPPSDEEFKHLKVLFTSDGKEGAGGGQVVRGGVCGDAGVLPDRCGEDTAEPQGPLWNSVIRGKLGAESLLLGVERSQPRWLRHLIRMLSPRVVPRTSYWEEAPG